MTEEKNNKRGTTKFGGILYGIGRYILGLLILVLPAIIIFLKSGRLDALLIMIVAFPYALIVDPAIIIGLYFMLTGKTRIRLDITLLLIAIICIAVIISSRF